MRFWFARLTIIPTPKAVAIAAIAATCAWAGSLLGLFPLFVFAVALGIILLTALAMAMLGGLRSWKIERTMEPVPPSVGDAVTVQIRANALGLFSPSLALFERTPWGTRRIGIAGSSWSPRRGGEMRGRQSNTEGPLSAQWEIFAAARGLLEAGPGQVFRHDLFGLFRRRVGEVPTTRVIVHPARFPLSVIGLVEQGRTGSATDPLASGNLGDMRTYVPGDDPRRVNWKLSARSLSSGNLTITELERSSTSPSVDVVLELDQLAVNHGNPPEPTSERELAISIAASLIEGFANARVLPSGSVALVIAVNDRELERCTGVAEALDTLALLESLEAVNSRAVVRDRDPAVLRDTNRPITRIVITGPKSHATGRITIRSGPPPSSDFGVPTDDVWFVRSTAELARHLDVLSKRMDRHG